MATKGKYGLEFVNEVTTRKGKTLIFTALKKYVEALLDEGEYSEDENNWHIKCPKCVEEHNYHKHKLWVLKDYTASQCWHCQSVFIDVNDDLDFTLPKVDLFNRRHYELVKLPLTGPQGLELFKEQATTPSQELLTYLKERRNPYVDVALKHIKCRYGEDSVYFPFYFQGELIYYLINFTNPNGKLKYYLPPIQSKPLLIFGTSPTGRYVLVEGPYDAIAALFLYKDRTPVASLGSTITDYQIEMFRALKPKDILVSLDKTDLSIKVVKKMMQVIDYADYSIVKSYGEDPDERLKRLIKES